MNLDDLIAQVRDAAITAEPLDLVAAAMGVKAELDELTDSLIGHFVDQARRAGCSWSEIGAAMGVTKQAAQQRHTAERPRRERPWRFGQWTDRAKTVVREANGAAIELGHDYLGTEHLLLGLLAVPQGLAGRILVAEGVTPQQVLAAMDTTATSPRRHRHRRVSFTPRTKEVVERALANALRLGHNYVGTEHLLLGLFDVPEGIGAKVLVEAGITKDGVEAQVIQRLASAS